MNMALTFFYSGREYSNNYKNLMKKLTEIMAIIYTRNIDLGIYSKSAPVKVDFAPQR